MRVLPRGVDETGGMEAQPRPTLGLVLGAGGVVGQAYQVGVLAALEREANWDPRDADLIVGTSAGSVTGAAIRVGVPATDLAASTYGVPMSRAGGALLKRIIPDDSPLPVPSVSSLFRPWNPPSLALIGRTVRRPLAFRPDVAAMTLLPRGQVDISARARALHEMVGDTWPEGLWICAARRTDGGRVVFGRDGSPRAPLAAAVLAATQPAGKSGATTAPGSSSGGKGPPRPRWPRPSWPRAPSRGISPRSPSATSSTSTGACTPTPTPMCSRPSTSTP